VEELGFVESAPKQDGRNMIMVLGPHKKKSEAKAEAKAERDERAALRAADREAEHQERIEHRTAAQSTHKKKVPRRSENLDPDM
jgi:translation initiation factor IF-3